MEVQLKHFQFKHPCNTLVVGMTGSGKTQLVIRILKNFEKIFYNMNKRIINILWCYGQIHSLINFKFRNEVLIKYIHGLPNEDLLKKFKPDIVIIDDLMNEMNKDKAFENIFIKKSHHSNISTFFLVQNLFYNSKSMRTISLNCHYMILMKNPRDKSQIFSLARQIYPTNTNFLIEAYNNATEKAFGYIQIDLTPDTPEILRIRTNITPEENNNQFTPLVFIPKDVEKS